jgi:hypothetical protein
MLYVRDAELNQAIQLLGWAGTQSPAVSNDYLMAADANLGNKSNHSILRQLTYDVEIADDGSLKSRATVAYDYPRSLAEQDPAVNPEFHGPIDYNNILQVFAPASSKLTTAEAEDVLSIASDTHTAFVTSVEILYDSGGRYQFSYETPPLIQNLGPYHRYRLLLQKQPGMIAEIANVQVSLPPNAVLVSASPEAAASYNLDRPILEFRLELVSDQWIEVIYRDS